MKKDVIEIILKEQSSTLNIDASPETLLVRLIKADLNAPLSVPEELQKPHVLIKETKRY